MTYQTIDGRTVWPTERKNGFIYGKVAGDSRQHTWADDDGTCFTHDDPKYRLALNVIEMPKRSAWVIPDEMKAA